MTEIAVPIRPRSLQEGRELVKQIERSGAGVVEIWCDRLDWGKELLGLVDSTDLPVLVTLKDASEQGEFNDGEDEYRQWVELCQSISGIKYVDIGLQRVNEKLAKFAAEKLIISYHNFVKTPDNAELDEIIAHMQSFKPQIIKLAVQCDSAADCQRLLKWQESLIGWEDRRIVIGMGEFGRPTRIEAQKYRNALTFAALETTKSTAPGQLSVAELSKIWSQN